MKSTFLKRTLSIAVSAAMAMSAFVSVHAYDSDTIRTIAYNTEGAHIYPESADNQVFTTVEDGSVRGTVTKVVTHDLANWQHWAGAFITMPKGSIKSDDKYIVAGMKIKTTANFARFHLRNGWGGSIAGSAGNNNADYVGNRINDGNWHSVFYVYDKSTETANYGKGFTVVDGVQSYGTGFLDSNKAKALNFEDMSMISVGFSFDVAPAAGTEVVSYMDDIALYVCETEADYLAIINGQYPKVDGPDVITVSNSATAYNNVRTPASTTKIAKTEALTNNYTHVDVNQAACYNEVPSSSSAYCMTGAVVEYPFEKGLLVENSAEDYPYFVQRVSFKTWDNVCYVHLDRIVDGTRYSIQQTPGISITTVPGYNYGNWNDLVCVYNRQSQQINIYLNGVEYDYYANKAMRFPSFAESRFGSSIWLNLSPYCSKQPDEGTKFGIDFANAVCTLQKDAPDVTFADKLSLIDDATGAECIGTPASTTVTENDGYTTISVNKELSKEEAKAASVKGNANPFGGAYVEGKVAPTQWSKIQSGKYNYLVYGAQFKGFPTYGVVGAKDSNGKFVEESQFNGAEALTNNELWDGTNWSSYYIVYNLADVKDYNYVSTTTYVNGEVYATGYKLKPYGSEELRLYMSPYLTDASVGTYSIDVKAVELYASVAEPVIPVPQKPVTPELKLTSEFNFDDGIVPGPADPEFIDMGDYTFSVKATSTLTEDKTVFAIIAFYDADGRVIAVEVANGNVVAGASDVEITATYTVDDPEGYAFAKTFILDENLAPLQ